MVRILAQADIARDNELGELLPDELSRKDDRRVGVVGGGASRVLGHVEGDAEEDDGFEALCDERGEEAV